MTRVKVVAQAQVESEVASNLPVVLEERAHLQVPPVPERCWQTRTLAVNDSRVHARRLVYGDQQRRKGVGEVVRGTGYIEFAVFDVAAEVNSDLEVVFSVRNRNHVRIRVDVLVERLRISRVGSEAHRAVIKTEIGNAGQCSTVRQPVMFSAYPTRASFSTVGLKV